MDKLKRFKKYSLRERAEKLPYAGEYFQPDDSCYLPHEVDPYVAALEKRCAELREERDTIYSEMGSYWGVELKRRIEVERQRDCLADELDALAAELIERDKPTAWYCKGCGSYLPLGRDCDYCGIDSPKEEPNV